MKKEFTIRWTWLKVMYVYTIIGAGSFGLGMLILPEQVKAMLAWPVDQPLAFGILGAVWLAFGLVSLLGLWSPLKFVPVLLLQLCYKTLWVLGVFLPLALKEQFPEYGLMTVIIFASYILGDLIAIPFPYLFGRRYDLSAQHAH